MAKSQLFTLFCVLFLFYVLCESFTTSAYDHEEKKIHIVYMGALPRKEVHLTAYYASILQRVGVSGESLVRSYTKSFGGFAANITKKQQQALQGHDEVVSVFPSKTLKLHTTESWDFMGFHLNVSRNPTIESDIIIGLFDSGIWPTSDSFNDSGLSSPPEKWKGTCSGGKNFKCNNKIIGARFYTEDSVLDKDGHGSHTSSIAAGSVVENAGFFGIAQGTARGAVPSARIAMYKVCSDIGCNDHDILAAFDDAIADGVDILSISLGPYGQHRLEKDSISIGSFHAMAKDILTVQAAGNSFVRHSIGSVAPWLISVAASTTSRLIMNKVQFGKGSEEYGYAVNSFDLHDKKFPMVYGNDAHRPHCQVNYPEFPSSCNSCLDRNKVKGKIVLCDSMINIQNIPGLDDTGYIFPQDSAYDVSYVLPFAGSLLSHRDYKILKSYYNSTMNPEATILTSELFVNNTAPMVATFSSRGPLYQIPDILKPDITAPGVAILAAFTPLNPPSFSKEDHRISYFNILSGTSMACPHVAGVAAYVKSMHPDWSSSAIKSALMTTATYMNASQSGDGNNEFAFGSGLMNPIKALSPGMVYETNEMDYVKILCDMGFNISTVSLIVGENTTCPEGVGTTPRDLNYPTMTAALNQSGTFSFKFPRTVTNVGNKNSTYKAKVSQIRQCNITVEPSVLSFKKLNEKQSFIVNISGNISDSMISASLEWSDGINIVRSPIVVYINKSIYK